MESTVAELKGEPVAEPLDSEINIPLSAFISDEYVPAIDQRMSIYRRLAKAGAAGDITAIKEELVDRYGKMPLETENLLLKILLKVYSVKAGVKKLDLTDTHLCFQLAPGRWPRQQTIKELFKEKKLNFEMVSAYSFKLPLNQKTHRNGIVFARNLLKEIMLRVKNK